MADLRAVATTLGFTDVSTLINSGNLVYRSSGTTPAEDEARLHEAIAGELGVQCTVFVRTREEVATVLRECPLMTEAAQHPSRLVVTVWDESVNASMLAEFTSAPVTVERFVAGAHALYCWFPDGISASTTYEKAARRLGDHITGRNWSSMQKLLARLDALHDSSTNAHGASA